MRLLFVLAREALSVNRRGVGWARTRLAHRRLGLAELEPVAERVVDVEAAVPGSAVGAGLVAGGPQALRERGQVVDDEAGMRLAGRGERLLDADVELLVARPGTSSRRARRSGSGFGSSSRPSSPP